MGTQADDIRFLMNEVKEDGPRRRILQPEIVISLASA